MNRPRHSPRIAAEPRRAGSRRRWVMIAGGLACAALAARGLVAGYAWYTLPARVAGELPAAPDASRFPAELARRLAEARQGAGVRHRTLEAAADYGRLCHANGWFAEAAAVWEILHREQPAEARWAYLLADTSRAASDYAAMEDHLRRATELDPRYPGAWLQLANLKLKTGRLDEARQDFARRLELLPNDPYAQLGLARIAQQQRQADEARRRIEDLVRTNPQFPPGQNLLAEILAAEGRTEEAARRRWLGREAGRFREADDPWLDELAQWCFDLERLHTLGTIQFQTQRGDRGRALFERMVAIAPDHPYGHESLGEYWLETGDAARGRGCFERALALAGPSPAPSLFLSLSRTWRALGEPERALQAVRDGIARVGDSPDLQAALGPPLADLGRHAEAIAAYEAALGRTPQDATTRHNLAISLLETGRPRAAEEQLRAALQNQPRHLESLRLLGELAMREGRLEEAGVHWQLLLDSNPGVPEARRLVADWHGIMGQKAERSGNRGQALQHYRQGLGLHPESADLNGAFGVLALAEGNAVEAVGALEKCRLVQPKNYHAGLVLAQAYVRLGRIADARRTLEETATLAERAGDASTVQRARALIARLPRS